MAQPAACACGQVLFDIGDKKPGDALSCPWCERKYRYAGDGKVELVDGAKGSGELAKVKAAAEPAKAAESAKPAKAQSERLKKADVEEKIEKSSESEASEKQAKPLVSYGSRTHKKPDMRGGIDADPGLVIRPSVRKRTPQKGDIPGGVLTMIIFIVIFNALAFTVMVFFFPAQPDGARITPWHTEIAKGSIWPLIIALLAGHFVGFIAWSTYLYKKQLYRQSPPPPST